MRNQGQQLKSASRVADKVAMQRSHVFLALLAIDTLAVANVLLSVARFFV